MRKIQIALPLLAMTYMCACGDGEPDEAATQAQNDTASTVASVVGVAEGTALENVGDVLERIANSDGGLFERPGLGDFQFDYEIECQDADGNVLANCGPATASVDVATDVNGTITLPRFQGEFGRSASWRLLTGETVTINGTDAVQATVSASGPEGEGTLSVEAAGELSDVTYNRLSRRFTSGTATLVADIDYTHTAGGTENSGSHTVEVLIDFAAKTMTITVDGEHVFEFARAGGDG